MDDNLNQEIGIFARREVEARILKSFLENLTERFDEKEVYEVLDATIRKEARAVGKAMRETTGEETIESFANQWEPWFRGGALEIEELEKNETSWQFNVTRCKYAELYSSLGMQDLGAVLSCNRDAELVEGFGKNIVLERKNTIVQGASCCDFKYKKV